jgi:hypothetical protein
MKANRIDLLNKKIMDKLLLTFFKIISFSHLRLANKRFEK